MNTTTTNNNNNNPIAKFRVTIPASAKNLAKFCGKNEYHPASCYVHINPRGGYIAATDTHVMQLFNVDCVGTWPDEPLFSAKITPAAFSKLAGKTVDVEVYRDGKVNGYNNTYDEKTVITCDGSEMLTRARCNCLDFRRVVPAPDALTAVHLTPEGLKVIQALCTRFAKSGDASQITVEASTFRKYATVTYVGANDDSAPSMVMFIELAEPVTADVRFSFAPALGAVAFAGASGILRTSEYRPIVIEDDADVTFIMPKTINPRAEEVNYDARNLFDRKAASIEDLARTIAPLRELARSIWNEYTAPAIREQVDYTKSVFTAKEVSSSKELKYIRALFATTHIEGSHSINAGNIIYHLPDGTDVFAELAQWEKVLKLPKTLFAL